MCSNILYSVVVIEVIATPFAYVTYAILPLFDDEPTYFSAHRACHQPMIRRRRGFLDGREGAGSILPDTGLGEVH